MMLEFSMFTEWMGIDFSDVNIVEDVARTFRKLIEACPLLLAN